MANVNEILTHLKYIKAEMNAERVTNLFWLKEKKKFFDSLQRWVEEIIEQSITVENYHPGKIADMKNTEYRILEVCNATNNLLDEMIETHLDNRIINGRAIGNLKANLTLIINLLDKLVIVLDMSITSPNTKNQSQTHILNYSSIDFVLVTALPEERDAVLNKFPEYSKLPPSSNDIRTYYQSKLPVTFSDGSFGSYNIILMSLLGMGRVQAAMATSDAIRRWKPRYILLIGIAGGISSGKVSLGDLLIADQVVDYELQKITDSDTEIRWEVQRAEPRLLEACNNFSDESWLRDIECVRPGPGTCKKHIGPVASGDKVVAFGDVLKKYQKVWPKLIGVEMEAAGVATAVFQAPERLGFFMVRSVSDLADKNKGAKAVEKWRQYACDVAATFAISFLRSGPVEIQSEKQGLFSIIEQ